MLYVLILSERKNGHDVYCMVSALMVMGDGDGDGDVWNVESDL